MCKHLYLITITVADGSQRCLRGLCEDGFDAVIQAMTLFPQARRIAARRLA